MSIPVRNYGSFFYPSLSNFYKDRIIRMTKVRGGSRTAARSKMECFVIIVNGWKPLNIITKHSILDLAAALDPPLKVEQFSKCSFGKIGC